MIETSEKSQVNKKHHQGSRMINKIQKRTLTADIKTLILIKCSLRWRRVIFTLDDNCWTAVSVTCEWKDLCNSAAPSDCSHNCMQNTLLWIDSPGHLTRVTRQFNNTPRYNYFSGMKFISRGNEAEQHSTIASVHLPNYYYQWCSKSELISRRNCGRWIYFLPGKGSVTRSRKWGDEESQGCQVSINKGCVALTEIQFNQ